ncbi:hypothetical protein HNY73_011653 [Argiope bruennichi]|uniref:Uncharacterized protein n=1 Tax=Argiope bruennichi TaxID=94029 RepID=A0A8T0F1B7_ARGBR|nr:hypothetical protein HNY73_011653 [Argiope bruennichi]
MRLGAGEQCLSSSWLGTVSRPMGGSVLSGEGRLADRLEGWAMDKRCILVKQRRTQGIIILEQFNRFRQSYRSSWEISGRTAVVGQSVVSGE